MICHQNKLLKIQQNGSPGNIKKKYKNMNLILLKCIFATIHFGICLQYTLFSNNHCSVREDKDYINLLCKFVTNVSDCTYAGYFHDLY